MIVDDIDGIGAPLRVLVEELAVLVDLPEDDLAVEAATDYAISRILIQARDVGDVAVVGVHVHHLSDVPHFEGAIIAHCIELIVLFVELDAGDRVAVTHKGLDLLLVVDVPDANASVLASTYHVLSIG